MSDENAPVTKHYRHAKEHLAGLHERAAAVQGLTAFWAAEHAQAAAQPPTPPQTESKQ